MWRAACDPPWALAAWRQQARKAWCAALAPESIDWTSGTDAGLFGAPPVDDAPAVREAPAVPRALLELAEQVLAHRDGGRRALMYRLFWRIASGEPALLEHETDPDVRRARQLEKAVARDIHKMHAFVRFRAVPGEANAFVAWYEPDHAIVELAAPFFARRFAGMRWAIVTPERRATWDGQRLAFGDGGHAHDVPPDDAAEPLWRRYYASIFNPTRANPRAMRAEMPVRFWKHLPEARDIPALLRDAAPRTAAMVGRAPEPARLRIPAPVRPDISPAHTLDAVHAGVAACRACPLWAPATRAVPGAGPRDARVVIVGEQPGDEEDLRGQPFVGPAGRLLDRALAAAGLDRDACYLTNAVKHFRFEQRGKRRIHQRATSAQQSACRPWLQAELASVRPERIVCLGATAASAVLGRQSQLMRERGCWQRTEDGTAVLATVHPSWILRQPASAQEAAFALLVADLALVAAAVAPSTAA